MINRQPTGLLGFLGIKNSGRNPTTLSEQVAATWDASALYLQDAAEIIQLASSIPSVGSIPQFTPPQGEVWYVWNFAIRSATLGAAEQLSIQPAIFSQNNNVVMQIGPASVRIGTVGQIVGCYFEGPLVLSKGASLGVICDVWAGAAAITTSYQLRFTRMTA